MELTKQEREIEKLTAETFASLSLGLWAVALIGYLTSGISWMTYFLVIVGAMSALFGIYLVLRWNWKQKQVLKYLEANKILKVVKLLVWLVALAIFAVNLIQTKVGWLIVTGLIIAIITAIVFYVGIWKTGGQERETRETTEEAKVENNTQQQEGCSNEDIYSKLAHIERKIDLSSLTQRSIAFYTLGTAFVILGVSLWPGLLEYIGMDMARFYSINPVALIVLGFIAIIYASVSQRAGREKLKKTKTMGTKGRKNVKSPRNR